MEQYTPTQVSELAEMEAIRDAGPANYENNQALAMEQMQAQQEPSAQDILINTKEGQKAQGEQQKFMKMAMDLEKRKTDIDVAIKEFEAQKEQMDQLMFGQQTPEQQNMNFPQVPTP